MGKGRLGCALLLHWIVFVFDIELYGGVEVWRHSTAGVGVAVLTPTSVSPQQRVRFCFRPFLRVVFRECVPHIVVASQEVSCTTPCGERFAKSFPKRRVTCVLSRWSAHVWEGRPARASIVRPLHMSFVLLARSINHPIVCNHPLLHPTFKC